MFVLVQYEAVATLAHVGAHRVGALVLAAAIILTALILVCGDARDAHRPTSITEGRHSKEREEGRKRG